MLYCHTVRYTNGNTVHLSISNLLSQLSISLQLISYVSKYDNIYCRIQLQRIAILIAMCIAYGLMYCTYLLLYEISIAIEILCIRCAQNNFQSQTFLIYLYVVLYILRRKFNTYHLILHKDILEYIRVYQISVSMRKRLVSQPIELQIYVIFPSPNRSDFITRVSISLPPLNINTMTAAY